MFSTMIRNGTEFPMQKLKVTHGSIPKSIFGSYIKNGPGLLTLEEHILPHWFMGNSGLLKIQIHDGEAYARYKMLETPSYKRDISQKNFNRPNPFLAMAKKYVGFGPQDITSINNSASTSILRLPNTKDFLALYEGGLAYRVQQKQLQQVGFDNFGFVQKGFSAHPKVDPQNGDIFNIGFNTQVFDVYRMSKDLKLVAKNSIKLRVPQSLHDCCLAGDYLVVFQCPLKLNFWKLLKGQFGPSCYSIDNQYKKTIVYILRKDNLQLVKQISLDTPEAFFTFHFTNGYLENNKIYVQYAKYPGQNAQKLFDVVQYMPNYVKKDGDKKKFNIQSELQTLEINLQDFSTKFAKNEYDCEFPLCQDYEVGKKWQYSYFISKDKGSEFCSFDTLVRYDRVNNKTLTKTFKNSCIVEPALIRTKEGLFILILRSTLQKCVIEILQGQNFETIAQIQLPQFVPFGFHGKWLNLQNKDLLQSVKL